MSIDQDIPVAATLTDFEIFQAVCEQDQEINVNYSERDECIEENPPTNAEMRQPHDTLKRGVQHRSTYLKKYENEQYINELLRNNCRQATINEFLTVIF
ncbi:hypothetical protein AVEN_248483-1 [Araneus ventricosus]|uniref:Uncharacterized protein n=1 Tax=Araneus ventricosus TaxID=182803 RepID=A0A4Y2WL18_ARAVE|nr:hypothetical protein AVEN_248483-1 [Araneus ventricosus]